MMKRIKKYTSPTRQRGNRLTANRSWRGLPAPVLGQDAPATSRGGVTLTEVLMSILCMGIGVVAVASLFPIALLRSAQATQLTSATILRFNAETLIDVYDEFPYTDPTATRNLVFNPDYRFNPNDPADPATNDADFFEHFGQTYLIDPLGAMIVREENGLPRDQGDPGNPTPAAQQDWVGRVGGVGGIRRFDALRIFSPTYTYPDAVTDQRTAENVVTLPDSWITLYEDIPASTAMDGSSVTLTNNTQIDYADARSAVLGGDVRVVLFSKDGNLSEVRPITNPDPMNGQVSSTARPNEIWWTNPLPNNNQYYDPTGMATNPGAVSRVRIEAKERRYTWLLTVRNSTQDVLNPSASVDVVIFFRRSLSAEEETPFTLTYRSPRKYELSGTPKFLKKGGFMLDTNFGKWHRIQAVSEDTPPIVTIERDTIPNNALDGNQAVFMRGVVDVYPLNRKPSR